MLCEHIISFRNLTKHVYITIVTSTPSIESCQTRVLGRNGSGEVWSNIGSPECSSQQNMYGRFQVSRFIAVLKADFNILIKDIYKSNRPNFVTSELFGVTDLDIRIRKVSVTGKFSAQNNINNTLSIIIILG